MRVTAKFIPVDSTTKIKSTATATATATNTTTTTTTTAKSDLGPPDLADPGTRQFLHLLPSSLSLTLIHPVRANL